MTQIPPALRADAVYAGYTRNVRKTLHGLNPERDLAEVKRMHATRRIRSLNTSSLLQNSVVELSTAQLQNQAYRSRCVEIKMTLLHAAHELANLINNCQLYIGNRYSAQLMAQFPKAKADRSDYVAGFTAGAHRALDQINSVIGLIDLVIQDMDQARWALKGLQDAINMQHQERFDG